MANPGANGILSFRWTVGPRQCSATGVRPIDFQWIGHELALKWPDGTETFLTLEALRRGCPCAGCHGETDVLGKVHRAPAQPYSKNSFQIVRSAEVGGYALQPFWADGHGTGLYSWEYLRRLGGIVDKA